jgi:anti-sigma-K factor RskA
MGRTMSHAEIAELLGAYALDAVDPDEAGIVAAHVEVCPRCEAELAEYLEVAGMLANVGGEAPSDLWDRISEQVTLPQVDPGTASVLSGLTEARGLDEVRVSTASRRNGRSPGLRWAISVVAAVAAVAVLLGLQVPHLETTVNNLSALSEHQGMTLAVQAALLDPSAQRITLAARSSAVPTLAVLILLPSGSAYFINSRLAPLPKDQTYQLWGVVGRRTISLGLLGNQPTSVPFTLGTGATVTLFAVTEERAGGVVVSTQAPVAQSATLTT